MSLSVFWWCLWTSHGLLFSWVPWCVPRVSAFGRAILYFFGSWKRKKIIVICWWSMELPNCASNTRRRFIHWTKCLQIMIHDDLVVELIAFDPNDEDSFYLNVNGHIVVCNIITRRWSKVASFESDIKVNSYFYQFVFPWWPTPVPRLPQHAQNQPAHGGGTSSWPGMYHVCSTALLYFLGLKCFFFIYSFSSNVSTYYIWRSTVSLNYSVLYMQRLLKQKIFRLQ